VTFRVALFNVITVPLSNVTARSCEKHGREKEIKKKKKKKRTEHPREIVFSRQRKGSTKNKQKFQAARRTGARL